MIPWFLSLDQVGQVILAVVGLVSTAVCICKVLDCFIPESKCKTYDW
jgi:hypothetical protein